MSDAARELGISQPGVSLHLNSLEAYMGCPLFERSTRKMIPTAHARQLYNKISDSLLRLEAIEHALSKKAGHQGVITLTIGVYPGLFRQLLVPYISQLGCNVTIILEDNEKLCSLLEDGSVDMIITTKEISARNVSCELLGESRFVLVAGKDTDESKFLTFAPDDKRKIERWLKQQTWYNTTYGQHLKQFWKLNFGKEPDFNANFVIPDKQSILFCLRNGSGLAILPASLCRDAIEKGEIKLLWKGNAELKNRLYISQRKSTLPMEQYQKAKEIIMEQFQRTHD